MKKLALLIFLLIVPIALAQSIPNPTGFVNDYANVLAPQQQAELKALATVVEANTTAEMAILTVDTVSPLEMSQYAQEVFDQWKIGKSNDNGLLILYAKQENKIWVQTGYGLEGILPDAKVGRILDETFVPARAGNDSAGGIVSAAQAYADVIMANAEEVRSGRTLPGVSNEDVPSFIFVLVFIFVFPAIGAYASVPKCQNCGARMKFV
jgi:uncharacterized protein